LRVRGRGPRGGLPGEGSRAETPPASGWTGRAELVVPAAEIEELYGTGSLDCAAARDLPCHTGLVLGAGGVGAGSALGRVLPDKSVRLVRGDREAFGLRGRSAEQRVALELLLDPEIRIVSLAGPAPASRPGRCGPGSKR